MPCWRITVRAPAAAKRRAVSGYFILADIKTTQIRGFGFSWLPTDKGRNIFVFGVVLRYSLSSFWCGRISCISASEKLKQRKKDCNAYNWAVKTSLSLSLSQKQECCDFSELVICPVFGLFFQPLVYISPCNRVKLFFLQSIMPSCLSLLISAERPLLSTSR